MATDSEPEVYLAPVIQRQVLGYCKGLKHPTAYQRHVLVRCKAPLLTEEAKLAGLCSYCLRKARNVVTGGDKDLKKLKETVKSTFREADAYVNGLGKGLRQREKLASRIHKKRRNLTAVAPILKKKRDDVQAVLKEELEKSTKLVDVPSVPLVPPEELEGLHEKALTVKGMLQLIRAGQDKGLLNELPVDVAANQEEVDEEIDEEANEAMAE